MFLIIRAMVPNSVSEHMEEERIITDTHMEEENIISDANMSILQNIPKLLNTEPINELMLLQKEQKIQNKLYCNYNTEQPRLSTYSNINIYTKKKLIEKYLKVWENMYVNKKEVNHEQKETTFILDILKYLQYCMRNKKYSKISKKYFMKLLKFNTIQSEKSFFAIPVLFKNFDPYIPKIVNTLCQTEQKEFLSLCLEKYHNILGVNYHSEINGLFNWIVYDGEIFSPIWVTNILSKIVPNYKFNDILNSYRNNDGCQKFLYCIFTYLVSYAKNRSNFITKLLLSGEFDDVINKYIQHLCVLQPRNKDNLLSLQSKLENYKNQQVKDKTLLIHLNNILIQAILNEFAGDIKITESYREEYLNEAVVVNNWYEARTPYSNNKHNHFIPFFDYIGECIQWGALPYMHNGKQHTARIYVEKPKKDNAKDKISRRYNPPIKNEQILLKNEIQLDNEIINIINNQYDTENMPNYNININVYLLWKKLKKILSIWRRKQAKYHKQTKKNQQYMIIEKSDLLANLIRDIDNLLISPSHEEIRKKLNINRRSVNNKLNIIKMFSSFIMNYCNNKLYLSNSEQFLQWMTRRNYSTTISLMIEQAIGRLYPHFNFTKDSQKNYLASILNSIPIHLSLERLLIYKNKKNSIKFTHFNNINELYQLYLYNDVDEFDTNERTKMFIFQFLLYRFVVINNIQNDIITRGIYNLFTNNHSETNDDILLNNIKSKIKTSTVYKLFKQHNYQFNLLNPEILLIIIDIIKKDNYDNLFSQNNDIHITPIENVKDNIITQCVEKVLSNIKKQLDTDYYININDIPKMLSNIKKQLDTDYSIAINNMQRYFTNNIYQATKIVLYFVQQMTLLLKKDKDKIFFNMYKIPYCTEPYQIDYIQRIKMQINQWIYFGDKHINRIAANYSIYYKYDN